MKTYEKLRLDLPVLGTPAISDEGSMKWLMIAALTAATIHSAHAETVVTDITVSNVQDHLLLEKTKAQNLVRQVKLAFAPGSPEYITTRQKYTAAQGAFNNYINAMLSNYAAGNTVNLNGSAALAADRNRDLENYVSSLKIPTKSITALLAVSAILLDIGEKLFTFIQNEQQEHRTQLAHVLASQFTWDDWDRIGN